MNYMKVFWSHELSDMPREIYHKIDDLGWEVRKVEVFSDGRQSYASSDRSSGSSFLAEVQIPSIEEIAKDFQFMPQKISSEDFEIQWKIAIGRNDFS